MNKTKYLEIGRIIREIPLEKSGLRYEWEELVQKMCTSDDNRLHAIGMRELGELKHKRPLNK